MKIFPITWLNGNLIPFSDAKISVASHSLHYGSGAFEGIRLYNSSNGPFLFRLHDHVERLIRSFSLFKTSIPWSADDISHAIIATVMANDAIQGYIRPLFFLGSESLGINPSQCSTQLSILVTDLPEPPSTIRVMISSVERVSNRAIDLHYKLSGLYLNSIFARLDALDKGFDEALFLNPDGTVAECSVSNIFCIKNGKIKTPKTGILPGLTRDAVIHLAKDLGVPVEIKTVTTDELFEADELFTTGTSTEIRPVAALNEKLFSQTSNFVTSQLQAAFTTLIQHTPSTYLQWITRIKETP